MPGFRCWHNPLQEWLPTISGPSLTKLLCSVRSIQPLALRRHVSLQRHNLRLCFALSSLHFKESGPFILSFNLQYIYPYILHQFPGFNSFNRALFDPRLRPPRLVPRTLYLERLSAFRFFTSSFALIPHTQLSWQGLDAYNRALFDSAVANLCSSFPASSVHSALLTPRRISTFNIFLHSLCTHSYIQLFCQGLDAYIRALFDSAVANLPTFFRPFRNISLPSLSTLSPQRILDLAILSLRTQHVQDQLLFFFLP